MMWLALLSTKEQERDEAIVLLEVLRQFTTKHGEVGIKRVYVREKLDSKPFPTLGGDAHLVDMADDSWLFDLWVALDRAGFPVVDLNDPATPFEINWPQS